MVAACTQKFTAVVMIDSPLCEQLDVLERNMADLFQRRRHGHCIQDVFLLVGVVCPSVEEEVPQPHVHHRPLLHAMHAYGRFVWLHLDGGHVASESWDLWCLKHRVLARQQLTQRDMDAQLNLVRSQVDASTRAHAAILAQMLSKEEDNTITQGSHCNWPSFAMAVMFCCCMYLLIIMK